MSDVERKGSVLLNSYLVELDEQPENERKVLGAGSYGTVMKVKGATFVAKQIHGILLGTHGYDPVDKEQWIPFFEKFEEECRLLSEMRHPNIVQFIGVCDWCQERCAHSLSEWNDCILT